MIRVKKELISIRVGLGEIKVKLNVKLMEIYLVLIFEDKILDKFIPKLRLEVKWQGRSKRLNISLNPI